MAKKKAAILTFEIKIGNTKSKYKLNAPQANIPKLGVVKAAELIQMPEVLEELVKINSGIISKID